MMRKELLEIVETLRFEDDDPVWEAAARALGETVVGRLYNMDKLKLLKLCCTPKIIPEDRATLKSVASITRPPSSNPVHSEEAVDIVEEVGDQLPKAVQTREDPAVYGEDSIGCSGIL